MGKKDGMRITQGACPYCQGDVMLEYKYRRYLGKCIRCSRIMDTRGMRSVRVTGSNTGILKEG